MILTKCKKFSIYKIQALPDIHLLKVLGIRKGISLQIQSKQPLGGPIVVKIKDRNIAIAKDVARNILVKEVV